MARSQIFNRRRCRHIMDRSGPAWAVLTLVVCLSMQPVAAAATVASQTASQQTLPTPTPFRNVPRTPLPFQRPGDKLVTYTISSVVMEDGTPVVGSFTLDLNNYHIVQAHVVTAADAQCCPTTVGNGHGGVTVQRGVPGNTYTEFDAYVPTVTEGMAVTTFPNSSPCPAHVGQPDEGAPCSFPAPVQFNFTVSHPQSTILAFYVPAFDPAAPSVSLGDWTVPRYTCCDANGVPLIKGTDLRQSAVIESPFNAMTTLFGTGPRTAHGGTLTVTNGCGGGSTRHAYDVPRSWTTQKVNTITPGAEPLNVVISGCSTVSIDDIESALNEVNPPDQAWDAVGDLFGPLSPCKISPENADVTGTGDVPQQLSLRLGGCDGALYELAQTGRENHARLWPQPSSGAWFASASYETLCVNISVGPDPILIPFDTASPEDTRLANAPRWWHCIDGGQGSYDSDGYDRGANDFARALVSAAHTRGWSAVQTEATGPDAGIGENGVAFSNSVHVVTIEYTTPPGATTPADANTGADATPPSDTSTPTDDGSGGP